MAEVAVRAIRSIAGLTEGQTGAIEEVRAEALAARGFIEILGDIPEEEEANEDDGSGDDGPDGDLDPDWDDDDD